MTTRRPVRGLAPIQAARAAPRPPGPATILGPDGRTWYRDEAEGLYYDQARTEVFSQSALRDLIERTQERLLRAIARPGPDPNLVRIANARTVEELRALWQGIDTVYRPILRGRRAVLELPPREDR